MLQPRARLLQRSAAIGVRRLSTSSRHFRHGSRSRSLLSPTSSTSSSRHRGNNIATYSTTSSSAASAGAQSTLSSSSSSGMSDPWLNTEYDAVVVGGGIAGCSVLYHLGLADMRGLLLEKSELTAGSTWHAAGLVTAFHPGMNMRYLHHYSIDLYKRLEEETGQAVGFHTPDSIRLVDSTRLDEAKYQLGKAALYDYPQVWITPERIRELHPLVNLDDGDVVGGIYNRADGHIDPSSVTNALAAGAKQSGNDIRTSCEVTSIEKLDSGQWEVRFTNNKTKEEHRVRSNIVINCGGLWCANVGKLAGAFTPITHIEHQYVITEPIKEVRDFQEANSRQLPVLRDLSGSYYLRQERDGLLIGPYESAATMRLVDRWASDNNNGKAPQPPANFGMELFQGDDQRLETHLLAAMERVPCMQTAGIQTVVNGPVAWPPDGNPLIGPVLSDDLYGRLNGFWQCCGLSYGIAQAGGIGAYLVDWIRNGEPPYELYECDPERYSPAWTTDEYTKAKVRETYGFNNHIVTPFDNRVAGRPLRKSPVYGHLESRGAVFGDLFGWEVPLWFDEDGMRDNPDANTPSFRRQIWHDAVGEECARAHGDDAVSLVDLSSLASYVVSSKGSNSAAEYLQRICCGRIPTKPYESHRNFMLSPTGKVIGECVVTRLQEDNTFYVTSGTKFERRNMRWMMEHTAGNDDVNIKIATEHYVTIGVVGGARAKEAVEHFGNDWSRGRSAFVVDSQRLPGSYEVHVARQDADWVIEALLKTKGARFIGEYCLDSLRMERGAQVYGLDITQDHFIWSANCASLCRPIGAGASSSAGVAVEFIGQDAVEAHASAVEVRASDTNTTMLSVNLKQQGTSDGHAQAHGNEPIYLLPSATTTPPTDADDASPVVGYTTSGAWSYRDQCSYVRAMVDHYALARANTPNSEWALYIDVLGEKLPSQQVDLS